MPLQDIYELTAKKKHRIHSAPGPTSLTPSSSCRLGLSPKQPVLMQSHNASQLPSFIITIKPESLMLPTSNKNHLIT